MTELATERRDRVVRLALALAAAGTGGWAVHTALTAGYSDFLLLHHSARGIVTGHDLYAGAPAAGTNLNPPHSMLLLAPLGWMPVEWAILPVWAAIVLSAWSLYRILDRAAPAVAVPVMFVLIASPAWYLGMRFANLGWPVAAGVTVAWLWHREGRLRAAGMLLGAMASMKLFLLLFGPYLLWRRQWSTLAAFSLGVGAMFAAGVAICGVAAYRSWLDAMGQIEWEFLAGNMSALGWLARLLTPSSETFGLTYPLVAASGLVRPLWLTTSVVVVAATWLALRQSRDSDAEWAAVLTAAFLISPLAWVYYLPLAAGPVSAVMSRTHMGRWRGAIVACLVMPYRASLLLAATAWWGTLTLGSSYAYGVLLLWLWVLSSAPRRSGVLSSPRTIPSPVSTEVPS